MPFITGHNLQAEVQKFLPPGMILELGRNSNFIKRLRKLNPIYLVYVLIFGLTSHDHPSINEIHRLYIKFDGTIHSDKIKIRMQSFSNRFNDDLVEFLRSIMIFLFKEMAKKSSLHLSEKFAKFSTIFIQDSTIIRLHSKLAEQFPSTRSRKGSGGLKISLLYSAISHGPKSIFITSERTHDIKSLQIGKWVKGALILLDLGYHSYKNIDKIINEQGYFVSRLKKNSSPKIIGLLEYSSEMQKKFKMGISLTQFLDLIPKEGKIDLYAFISFKQKEGNSKKKIVQRKVRIVCIWNGEKSRWHTYITNLSPKEYSIDEIPMLYKYRWEIEILFKELKSDYELGKLLSSRVPIVIAQVYTTLIRLAVSRELYKYMISCEIEEEKSKFSPRLWAIVLTENCAEFLSIIHQDYFMFSETGERWNELNNTLLYQAKRLRIKLILSNSFIRY